MQQLYMASRRLKELKTDISSVRKVEAICKCSIRITADDIIAMESDNAYGEFVAKNILQAYGRGFEMDTAIRLLNEDMYFSSVDLGQAFGNEKGVRRMKSRIIGKDGRAKAYIESVSGAKICVYGDTVSFIGTHDQISEAEAAVNTLLDGGTHRLAYIRMEAAHRKNKTARLAGI